MMMMEKESRNMEEFLKSSQEILDRNPDLYKALAGDEEAIRKMEELRKANEANEADK